MPSLDSSPSQKPRRIVSRVIFWSLFGLISLALVWEIYRPRFWLDLVSQAHYQPSEIVARLQNNLKLTSRGNSIFLASNPEVISANNFNRACARKESSVAILGCYDNQTIKVFHVTDSELDGVMETTSAHELLHAAYVRLNWHDRKQVDAWLNSEYSAKKTPELEERLAYYRRNDPDSLINELHSIFATEFVEVSPELEKYYGRYFSDRGLVVAYYQKYHQKFIDLYNRAQELKAQIDELEDNINQLMVTYQAKLKTINADIALFNQQSDAGYYQSYSQFITARRALLARIDSLENERGEINDQIGHYNGLVEEYNTNATQYEKLNKSLDSLSQEVKL